MGRSLSRGISTNFALNLLATAASSLSVLLIANWLEPSEWGRSAAILGLGQLLGSLLSFGTPIERIRRYSRLSSTESRTDAYRETLARLATACFVLLVGLSIMGFSVLIGSSLVVAAGVFVSLGAGNYFLARERFATAGLLLVGEKSIVLLAILLGTALGSLTDLTLPIAAGLAAWPLGFLALGLIGRGQVRPTLRGVIETVPRQWTGSVALGISSVAPSLLLADVSIVLAIAGSVQAGLYAIGSKLVAPLSIAATSIVSAILPRFSAGERGRLPEIKRRRILPFFAICVLTITALYVTAPYWVVLLFGDDYADAVFPVQMYLVNAVLILVTRIIVTILQAWDDERFVSWAVSGQVLFALVGISVGAAIGGAQIASVSVASTNFVLLVVLFVRLRHARIVPA